MGDPGKKQIILSPNLESEEKGESPLSEKKNKKITLEILTFENILKVYITRTIQKYQNLKKIWFTYKEQVFILIENFFNCKVLK